ncbi:MAG: SDR family oxidoreductase [Alphaproteobacteria bacterium]|jgi:NADP-dependent 3-hydroxy acid dehydrogenase YdfG|nr:SDR family oxidoreductase [Alphaproteobacteria bacterium]MDP7602672.1 SDR family oxidoreductase [Alphaproteobacteria bacterium]HJP22684.1 SDR family oxidoreductase [Alphaproteobacteria bacterium]
MTIADYATALVTGASSGIGAATVRALCDRGLETWALARRPERLAELSAETGCHTLAADVRDGSGLDAALEGLEIDVLVNSAGVGRGMEGLLTASPEDIAATTETNLGGTLQAIRALAPGMVARRRGHIVNIGSIMGLYPMSAVIYGATKGGIHMLGSTLRLELQGSGVRISEVSPGRVHSEFFAANLKDPAGAEALNTAFKLLTPEDVAASVVFVVDAPAHVNVSMVELCAVEQIPGGVQIAPLET